MEFQQRLYDLRKKAGLSQEELANLLGVTRQAVQKWEAGTSRPDMDNLVSLARYFSVTLDWLVTGQEEREPANQGTPVVVDNHYHYDRWHYEYKSGATWLGLPLVHINLAQKGLCRAKGVIAIGNVATGVLAIGGFSAGLLSIGGIALGLLALGGLGLGALAVGGIAVGGIALGGCAIGWLAFGGSAVGVYAVGGAAAASKVAIGGAASGALAIGEDAKGAVTFSTQNPVPPEVLEQAIGQAASSAPQWLRSLLAAAARTL